VLNKAEVQQILRNWTTHEWQVQGFGMLRTYLDGPGEPRLQIWDQRVAVWGDWTIHDHPWDFTSRIICGTLFNQRFEKSTELDPLPIWHQDPSERLYKGTLLVPGPEGGNTGEPFDIWLTPQPTEVYSSGDEYSQKYWELHKTRYDQGTITMIERDRVKESDTALACYSESVGQTFYRPRPATPDEIFTVTGDALKRWWL
jgi:hypothetical protein